jgi:hypothetical protein
VKYKHPDPTDRASKKNRIFSSQGLGTNSPRGRSDSTSSDELEPELRIPQSIQIKVVQDTDPQQQILGEFSLIYSKENGCFNVQTKSTQLLGKKQVILGLMDIAEKNHGKSMCVQVDTGLAYGSALIKMLKVVGFEEHNKMGSIRELMVDVAE